MDLMGQRVRMLETNRDQIQERLMAVQRASRERVLNRPGYDIG